jgi:hypothetical protein
MKTLLSFALPILLCCGFAGAQQYQILYNFGSVPNDGANPIGNRVADSAGNLYGVTFLGGASTCDGGCGTVFELSPNSAGGWSESILYNFCAGSDATCPDGELPQSGLVLDSAGNLYGVTDWGGTCTGGEKTNCGIVYELSPPSASGGAWTYTVIHAFCQDPNDDLCSDGIQPNGPLAIDAAGTIYGTVQGGGTGVYTKGAVYELSHSATGWNKRTIYSFCSVVKDFLCLDGNVPQSGLTFDSSGNLWGTTQTGGPTKTRQGGTVYKLTHGAGTWTETVIASFETNTLQFELPNLDLGAISIGPTGTLYTTYLQMEGHQLGGMLSMNSAGGDLETSWFGTLQEGQLPNSSLLIDDSRGLIYGTTQEGGLNPGDENLFGGVVFAYDFSGKENVIHYFCQQANCTDGYSPQGGLIQDKSGNLYGTTSGGGVNGLNEGTLFELFP